MKNAAEFRGAQTCGYVWYETKKDIPDLNFRVLKTQFKIRSDGTAVISSTFRVSGHKIIQADPLLISDQSSVSSESSPLSQDIEENSEQSTFDQEFSAALEDYLQEEISNPSSSNQSPRHMSPNNLSSSAERTIITQENVHQAMHELDLPFQNAQLSGSVQIFPLECDGYVSIHLDVDSKVHLVTYYMYETTVFDVQ
jgi:hypothetical protein